MAGLDSLVLRNRVDGTEQEREAFAVFILIGGTPRTEWLPDADRPRSARFRAHRRRYRPRERPGSRPDTRDECARDLCGRRCPSRLDQARGRRGRRGCDHHSPDPRVPERSRDSSGGRHSVALVSREARGRRRRSPATCGRRTFRDRPTGRHRTCSTGAPVPRRPQRARGPGGVRRRDRPACRDEPGG